MLTGIQLQAASFQTIQVGDEYRVDSKTTLAGWRLVFDPETKKEKRIPLQGNGRVTFREKLLDSDAKGVRKLIRAYEEVRFQRTVDGNEQEATLRDAVKQIIIERGPTRLEPFHATGHLQWSEVELILQHPNVPALETFLPDSLPEVGKRWPAPQSAVLELTGQHTMDSGDLQCEYKGIIEHQGRKLHQVALGGTVTGAVGPQKVRNSIRGAVYVDANTGRMVSFRAMGQQEVLGPEDKVLGTDQVDYQIVTRPIESDPKFTEQELANLPSLSEDRLQLIFENEIMGLRFYHPRRWSLVPVPGPDVLLQSNQSTLIVHVEPVGETPTAKAYHSDVLKELEKAKITAQTVSPPREHSGDEGRIGTFRLRGDLAGQPTILEYWLVERQKRGATLAARIRESDWPSVQKDPEAIIRSVELFAPKQ